MKINVGTRLKINLYRPQFTPRFTWEYTIKNVWYDSKTNNYKKK